MSQAQEDTWGSYLVRWTYAILLALGGILIAGLLNLVLEKPLQISPVATGAFYVFSSALVGISLNQLHGSTIRGFNLDLARLTAAVIGIPGTVLYGVVLLSTSGGPEIRNNLEPALSVTFATSAVVFSLCCERWKFLASRIRYS